MPKEGPLSIAQQFLNSQLNAQHLGQTSQTPKRVQLAINMVEIDARGQTKTLYKRNFFDAQKGYHLASMSKQFFAAALLQLIQDDSNTLDLEDLVCDHIPSWPKYALKVKVRHLLNHSSGLPEYTRSASTYLKNTYDPASVFRFVKNKRQLLQEPGTLTLYCNTNYVIIAYLIELISMKSIDRYMRESFFEPLQMRDTFVRARKSPTPKTITNYYRNNLNKYGAAIKTKNDYMPGDGGIYTTLTDLTQWAIFLSGKSILGDDISSQMENTLPLDSGITSKYGFGLKIKDSYMWHSGSWNGAVSYCRFYKAGRNRPAVWIVALGNCTVFSTYDMVKNMKQTYDVMKHIEQNS